MMQENKKKWYVDGKSVKDKYNVAYNLYSQSSVERANYDQQKTWNWKWEVNEMYSPISHFESKPYAITAAKQLDECTRAVDILAAKITGGLKNMYTSFSLKHNNEIIDKLINGSSKEGESVWQSVSREMAKDPKLAMQTVWELASLVDSSEAMRSFDAMHYEKELKEEIVDASKYEVDAMYRKHYDQDRAKSGEGEFLDWDDLPNEVKTRYKLYKHSVNKTGVIISMQEALELRQKYFETILFNQGAVTFFYDLLQQLTIISEDAESMFYNPENNVLLAINEAVKRLLLYGDCAIITEYNQEKDYMEVFVPQQDTVYWNVNKTQKITDIHIKYNMTLAQAQEKFEPEEFNLIRRAYNIDAEVLENYNQMATQKVSLIQMIKVSDCEYEPHLTVWVADTCNKDENYPIIRESQFQNLPVHICRLNVDSLTGRGTGHFIKIIRKTRDLNQLRISTNVAISRSVAPPIGLDIQISKQYGDLTPNKVKAIDLSSLRDPRLAVVNMTAQIDGGILTTGLEHQQRILQDIYKQFFLDVLDNYETQDVHSSAGSNAVIAAAQRALQHIAPFYDIVEPFIIKIASYFVKAVASKYDNVAVPNNEKMSSMLNVRLIGLNEKASKDVENQESLQLLTQIAQIAQVYGSVPPNSPAEELFDSLDKDKLIRKLFYKTPQVMLNPDEVSQIRQQRAEQQQQAINQEMQNQSALTGAQVREKNAKADQLAAQAMSLQSGNT